MFNLEIMYKQKYYSLLSVWNIPQSINNEEHKQTYSAYWNYMAFPLKRIGSWWILFRPAKADDPIISCAALKADDPK